MKTKTNPAKPTVKTIQTAEKKVIKNEIKTLKAADRKIQSDHKKELKWIAQEERRVVRRLALSKLHATRACVRELVAIKRRLAVLQGRL